MFPESFVVSGADRFYRPQTLQLQHFLSPNYLQVGEKSKSARTVENIVALGVNLHEQTVRKAFV